MVHFRHFLFFLLSIFVTGVQAESLSITPGFLNGGEYGNTNFIRFNVTDSSSLKAIESLTFAGPQGAVTHTVDWDTSCDSGYTKNTDGVCQQTQNQAPTLSCNAGFSLVNGQCQKVDVQAATQQCPADYTLVNGQCKKADVQPASYNCPFNTTFDPTTKKCVNKSYDVPSAYSAWISLDDLCPYFQSSRVVYDLEGKQIVCFGSTGSSYMVAPTLTCPLGYSQYGFGINARCQKDGQSGNYNYPTAVSCPSGYHGSNSYDGFTCIKTGLSTSIAYIVSPAAYCTNGAPIETTPNNYPGCAKTTYVDPSSITCPSGYTFNGNACDGFVYNPGTFSCSTAGYSYIGNGQCQGTLIQVANKNCPSGYDLINGQTSCQRILNGIAHRNAYFYLRVTSLFPGEHTIDITINNNYGDHATVHATFKYVPKGFVLQSGKNDLKIPAVAVPFVHLDGSRPLQTGALRVDKTLMTGSQPVYAALSSSAPAGLKIDGKEVLPGSTQLIGNYDLTVLGSRLGLTVTPMAEMEADYTLLLTVGSAQESIAAQINVHAWAWNDKYNLSTEKPVYLVGNYFIKPGEAQSDCLITTDENIAQSMDIFDSPTCVVKWEKKPAGATINQPDPKLTASPSSLDPETLEYVAYISDYDGTLYELHRQTITVTPVDPFGLVAFEPVTKITEIVRGIQEVEVTLRTTKDSLNCTPTRSIEKAKERIEGSFYCLFEFSIVPEGIEPSPTAAAFAGTVFSLDDKIISWTVSAFDPQGAAVLLNTQQIDLPVRDPKMPVMALSNGNTTSNGIRLVNASDGAVGNLSITADPSDVILETYLDDNLVSSTTVTPSSSYTLAKTVPLTLPDIGLDSQHLLKVVSRYHLMPDILSEFSIPVAGSPDSFLKLDFPQPIRDNTSVVTTEALPVDVQLVHSRNPEFIYDPAKHGQWTVELVKRISYSEYEPLTGKIALDANGKASFSLSLSDISNDQTLSVYARATIENSTLGFTNTLITERPYFVKVLYTDIVEGTISTNKIEGAAPLKTSISLLLKNREQFTSLGNTTWMIRNVNSGGWETIPDEISRSLYHTFEEGVYEIKAKLSNVNNPDAVYETAPIQVASYVLPEVAFEGDTSVLTDSSAQVRVALKKDNVALDPSDFDIQWSSDNGKTYTLTGPEQTFVSAEAKIIPIRVKVQPKDYAAKGITAFAKKNGSIYFRAPRPPIAYLTGLRHIDQDISKIYEFKAVTQAPYRDMKVNIKGRFILPNGDIVDGNTWSYNTESNMFSAGSVTLNYEAWIEGYENLKRNTRLVLYIRKYEFPEFTIRAGRYVNYAPTTASVVVNPLRVGVDMNDFTFDWSLPPGVESVNDSYNNIRNLSITKAGSHVIGVRIADERGNSTNLTVPLEVKEPDPLALRIDITPVGGAQSVTAPYKTNIFPRVSGGHPRDRVVQYDTKVNGQSQQGTYGGRVYYTFDAGNNQVNATVVTEYGVVANASATLDVAPNSPPTCSNVDVTFSSGYYYVTASCSDPENKLAKYNFDFNGKVYTTAFFRTYLREPPPGTVVRVWAEDVAGLASQVVTKTLN